MQESNGQSDVVTVAATARPGPEAAMLDGASRTEGDSYIPRIMEQPNSFEKENYSANVITTAEQYSNIRNSLIQLDEEAFEGKSAIAEHWYHAKFNPEDILIVLRKGTHTAIGYLLAHPSKNTSGKTAHVYSTVIAPEYRGKGLSDRLEDGLEIELRSRGYEYITRDPV